jgi:hypothetical protein
MTAIFDLVRATKGKFTADQAMDFFKGWKDPDSPRGPIMSGDPRHRSERLYPAPRQGRRQACQRRDRDDPPGQGPVERDEPAEITIDPCPPHSIDAVVSV